MTAPVAAPSRGERIDSLTGLRFVAAAIVAVEHFPEMIPGLDPNDAAQGGAGVSLFFVLSGFVLVYTYGERIAERTRGGTTRRFVVARFARLTPLHLLALTIIAPLVIILRDPFVDHAAGAVVVGLLANLLLVQAWLPFQVVNLWNGPAWSISVEAFFYAMFPFLLATVVWPMMRRRWVGRAIAAVAVIQVTAFLAISIAAGTFLLGRSGDVDGTRLIVGRLAHVPVLRLGEFVIGCLLASAHRSEYRRLASVGWRWLDDARVRSALLVGAVATVVAIQFTTPCPSTACYPAATDARALIDLRLFVSYLPVVVAIIAALAWGPTPISRLLATRPLVRLGEISYAFYILQWAAWLVINDGPTRPTQWEAFGAVGVTLVAAFVVHRWVEVPARNAIVARWAVADPSPATTALPAESAWGRTRNGNDQFT